MKILFLTSIMFNGNYALCAREWSYMEHQDVLIMHWTLRPDDTWCISGPPVVLLIAYHLSDDEPLHKLNVHPANNSVISIKSKHLWCSRKCLVIRCQQNIGQFVKAWTFLRYMAKCVVCTRFYSSSEMLITILSNEIRNKYPGSALFDRRNVVMNIISGNYTTLVEWSF